jgi:hypothetical protein
MCGRSYDDRREERRRDVITCAILLCPAAPTAVMNRIDVVDHRERKMRSITVLNVIEDDKIKRDDDKNN